MFVSGQDYETTLNTPDGQVEVLGEVEVNGDELIVKGIAVYPANGGDMRNQVHIGYWRAAVRHLQTDARAAGFKKLTLQGTRVQWRSLTAGQT